MAITPPRDINEIQVPPRPEHLPYHVAFIIDGIVREIFHVDERLGAILLGNPTIVQVESSFDGGPEREWLYDHESGTFTPPPVDPEEIV